MVVGPSMNKPMFDKQCKIGSLEAIPESENLIPQHGAT